MAGVYDLNKEMVLEGRLKKLNFTNPHASIELTVPNKDGTFTDWVLTTASIQVLTRSGVNSSSIKPGETLKITALPARNGNPAGFIRKLELGDREFIDEEGLAKAGLKAGDNLEDHGLVLLPDSLVIDKLGNTYGDMKKAMRNTSTARDIQQPRAGGMCL